jgi:hypothetical protein
MDREAAMEQCRLPPTREQPAPAAIAALCWNGDAAGDQRTVGTKKYNTRHSGTHGQGPSQDAQTATRIMRAALKINDPAGGPCQSYGKNVVIRGPAKAYAAGLPNYDAIATQFRHYSRQNRDNR